MLLRQAVRRLSLTQWIFVAMAVGIVVGWVFPESARSERWGFAATDLALLSTIFLRLIKALVVPLVFSTVVVGIAASGEELRAMGRLAVRAIILFTLLTFLALLVGWLIASIVKPGEGVSLTGAEPNMAPARPLTFAGVVEQAFPQSVVDAAVRNDVLQVLVFALLFGAALARLDANRREPVVRVLDGVAEAMFRFTAFVMAYAPVGIGAAMAVTVSQSGFGVLGRLGILVLSVLGALAGFLLAVLLPLALVARVPLGPFLRAAREPALVAFSAASSDAALPQALRALEAYGIPRRVVSFALPTALSFNLTGSTLFVGMATLFVAQAAGVPLSWTQQLAMMATLMLTTKGIAAVPRASLVILSATLTTFGLPLEGASLILAVDALMDMARTGVNMTSHCLATVVLAGWERTSSSRGPG